VATHTFTAEIESMNQGRGAAAALPFDPKSTFGRARAPVRVTVGEHEPFRTTVAVYGGTGWIGLRKDQLAEFGVGVGDPITMRVELDDGPREVEAPDELVSCLQAHPDARQAYESLSFTHRREYARWVAAAVKAETRERRAAKAVEMLREGVRTPG
jgi:Bacteriocin-protection, YdeI or OmpD-Associated/Domain of unknown function (DUF1905)